MDRFSAIKNHVRSFWVSIFLMAAVSGCSAVTPDAPTEAPRYYFGLIKLSTSAQQASTSIATNNTIQMWGIRVKDALTIGYAKERTVRVPMDCRIMVFIQSEQQMEQARQLLEGIKGDELCVIQARS